MKESVFSLHHTHITYMELFSSLLCRAQLCLARSFGPTTPNKNNSSWHPFKQRPGSPSG